LPTAEQFPTAEQDSEVTFPRPALGLAVPGTWIAVPHVPFGAHFSAADSTSSRIVMAVAATSITFPRYAL
jgi:hypothetical protein